MTVHRFACDSSDWEFTVGQDGRELVARLYYRGEAYGPEFRAANERLVQRAIARWLLLHADVAGGLQTVGEVVH